MQDSILMKINHALCYLFGVVKNSRVRDGLVEIGPETALSLLYTHGTN